MYLPGETKEVTLDLSSRVRRRRRILPHGHLQTRAGHSWAAAGHVVAWDQFELTSASGAVPEPKADGLPAVKLAEIPDHFVISNDAFSIAVDRESGSISSYNVGGKELLTAPAGAELLARAH